ncbi:transcriptional regulator [Salmonella enterica subsp. enterica serovar Kentucky]|nr:transcriptional regulator [Salmonella enterica subsp. enterica serovar Kentucky]EKR6739164.1 transcriptional regulator [Salmonella enterica]ELX1628770.1 transcriptional regulator [Salmonella enterica]
MSNNPSAFLRRSENPKNGKPALSPHHDWLKTGSQRQNAPLCIWFYPQ